MHFLQCDICKKTSGQTVCSIDGCVRGWFGGYLSTPTGNWSFDFCSDCGPQATQDLEELLREVKTERHPAVQRLEI